MKPGSRASCWRSSDLILDRADSRWGWIIQISEGEVLSSSSFFSGKGRRERPGSIWTIPWVQDLRPTLRFQDWCGIKQKVSRSFWALTQYTQGLDVMSFRQIHIQLFSLLPYLIILRSMGVLSERTSSIDPLMASHIWIRTGFILFAFHIQVFNPSLLSCKVCDSSVWHLVGINCEDQWQEPAESFYWMISLACWRCNSKGIKCVFIEWITGEWSICRGCITGNF